jgi:dihydroorotase
MLGAEGPLAPGPLQRKLGLRPYEAKLETDMVARDLRVLEKYPKARYHLLHVSSKDSIPMMLSARQNGFRVTSEVTPHHLYFSSDDIVAENKSFKMNPPIRGVDDREVLQSALAKNEIDWMATDHAPHEVETKTKEFALASFGTVGLETSLQTLLWMVKVGKLTPKRLVQAWSTAPAKFLGIAEEFGEIQVGKPFRAVLVNLEHEEKINSQNFWGLSKNSCFEGVLLPGKILGHATRSGWFDF